MLTWKDFVVLCEYKVFHQDAYNRCKSLNLNLPAVRMNSASRGIENALQKEGIPNRLLGGHRFFERMEVINALKSVRLLS